MRTAAVFLMVAGLTLLPASRTLAQRDKPQEVYKILGISVEGNTLSDPAAIIANSGLKVGDELVIPGDQISGAIHKLWSVKLFEDVQISIDRKVGNGVFLLIMVKEIPRFERIEYEGRNEISEDDIQKKISLVR